MAFDLTYLVVGIALLATGVLVPTDIFLAGGLLWRYAVPCALALGPMFFAGVIVFLWVLA